MEFLENLECGAAKSGAQTVMENVWKKLVNSKENILNSDNQKKMALVKLVEYGGDELVK